VDALLEGTVDFTPSRENALVAAMQSLPFFRLTYTQLTTGLLDQFLSKKQASTTPPSSAEPIKEEVYDAFFRYVGDATKDSSSQIIIVYHPTGELREDGTVHFDVDEGTPLFAEKCQEYGIAFVDMTQPFIEMYQNHHKLPHGFVTGVIGSGHLNADGHAAIAQQLGEIIAALGQGD
jgi:hypothetical protein